MSQTPGNDITATAERLFPGATVEPIDGRSWLASVTIDSTHLSIRQLDPGLTVARTELIHEYLAQADLVGITRLIHSERQGPIAIDIREWAIGDVLAQSIPDGKWRSLHLPASVDATELGSIAHNLGNLHAQGSTTSFLARAPHLRIKDMLTQTRRSLDLYERTLAGEIRKESRARRWLTSSRPLLTNAESALEQVGYLRDEVDVIGHLDLWGSHIVRGTGDAITYLDFANLGAAPASLDLARLLIRNGTWSGDRVELVLNRYAESNPISPLQRRTLPWLAALDAIAICGHLLARAHDEHRPLAEPHRRSALIGADQLLEVLHTLAAAFVPPPPRQWRRPHSRQAR